jgi:ASC-1-like (ASCH) protein
MTFRMDESYLTNVKAARKYFEGGCDKWKFRKLIPHDPLGFNEYECVTVTGVERRTSSRTQGDTGRSD